MGGGTEQREEREKREKRGKRKVRAALERGAERKKKAEEQCNRTVPRRKAGTKVRIQTPHERNYR
jgi:hypothetical protein